MVAGLFRKKVLILASAVSLFFLYVSARIRNKREELRLSYHSKFDFRDIKGPTYIMHQCKALGSVRVVINTELDPKALSDIFERNARNLFNADFGCENVCEISVFDVCDSENCTTLEMKHFILRYFRELDSRGVILRKRYSEMNISFMYDIIPDSQQQELLKDSEESEYLKEDLKVFGMMLALAIIHTVYLEIKFEKHFLHTTWNLDNLLYTLQEIDPQQYKLYRSLSYGDRLSHDKIIKFVKDSPKPFRELSDPDPLATEHSMIDFPRYDAAKQIFIDPFDISRKMIVKGMWKVLPLQFLIDNENLNEIFSATCQEFSLYDFKDNVDKDKNSILFIRALKTLSIDEAMKLYYKVTGFVHMPKGGFSRVPRIKIFHGTGKMFPEPFVIVIKPGISEIELAHNIRENIK